MSTAEQCVLCYEVFDDIIRLPCGNLACEKCLKDDYSDDTLFCQLCLKLHIGSDIRHLGDNPNDCLDIDTSADTVHVRKVSLDEIITNRISNRPDVKCTVDGCSRNALYGQLCFNHISESEKIKILGKQDAIARSLESTSLTEAAQDLLSGSNTAPSSQLPSPTAAHPGTPKTLLHMPPVAIFKLFYRQERLPTSEVLAMIAVCSDILRKEGNVLSLQAPLIVIG